MNRPIKIVKLAERERRAEAESHPPPAPEETDAEGRSDGAVRSHSNAREAAATIKGWIGDLRSQQRDTLASTRLHLSQAGLAYKPVAGRERKRRTG